MDRRFRTLLNEDDIYDKQRSSKKPAHDHFRRNNLSPNKQESSRRGYSGFTKSSSEEKSFRSSQEKRNETRSSIPTEAKSQVSKNLPESISSDASNFLHELHALPTEVFLKLVSLKLDKMEIDGFAELSELAKFINKSKEVVAKSLPPHIETVIKQMMLDKTGMKDTPVTQPVSTQVSPFDRERKDQPQGTNYSLITELLNQAKRECPPSASATSHQYASSTASHQNPQSYPGFSHGQVNFPYPSTYTPSSNESLPYNTASSNMTPANQSFSYNTASSNIPPVNENFAYKSASSNIPPVNENFAYKSASANMTSVIPGLTLQEEQRESYSAYNAYQSGNSQPSVSKYNFRY